ncbi:MAG: hypothetical protein K2M43_02575, partial [Mycoplasmoidaceae bacterium]|nr:hypothetical protein [Mycoplasmoidaceae bacterium]
PTTVKKSITNIIANTHGKNAIKVIPPAKITNISKSIKVNGNHCLAGEILDLYEYFFSFFSSTFSTIKIIFLIINNNRINNIQILEILLYYIFTIYLYRLQFIYIVQPHWLGSKIIFRDYYLDQVSLII